MTIIALLQQQRARTRGGAIGDAFRFWSAETIAAILGSPVENVLMAWPLIYAELAARGIADEATQIAALATIGVESGTFLPVPEAWYLRDEATRRAYLEGMYGYLTEIGQALGNLYPGDGWRYGGAGWIQLSGRNNYRTYGADIGVDLEAMPGYALDPAIAAKVFADYFQNHRSVDGYNMSSAARSGLWRLTRVLVNGGYNGWSDYIGFITNLQAAAHGG